MFDTNVSSWAESKAKPKDNPNNKNAPTRLDLRSATANFDTNTLTNYLKSLHAGNTYVDQGNCVGMYQIADFFQDRELLKHIRDHVIPSGKVKATDLIKISKLTETFDDKIANEITALDQENITLKKQIEELNKKLKETEVEAEK